MNFANISAITKSQANFSVYGPGELDWGNAYLGWTDSRGILCSRDGKLFEAHKLSDKDLNSTDSDIAALCIQLFRGFKIQGYMPNAIVIQKNISGQPVIGVFAYSNLVKFLGKARV